MTPTQPSDKVCLVTGAGSGVGRACALALARAGHSLVIAGRRATALAETANAVRETDQRVLSMPTDVTQPREVDNLFAAIADEFGCLDLLFNNAGAALPATPFEDLSLDDWQQLVNVNLTGAFLCAQRAFQMMKQQKPQGGRIIQNGSISAHVPRPHAVAYNATKHAITGLTKSISLEGRAYNIACGQIDIGNAATEMSASQRAAGALQADGATRDESCFSVEHVADAIVYMANLPLEANVQFMTVMATKMPYIGRG